MTSLPPRLFAISLLFSVATARADLLVLYPGSPGAGVVGRFDAATGVGLTPFGRDNEGLFALCVAANGDVFVGADILGAGLIYRFNRAGEYRGTLADVNGADFAALAMAPDNALHAIAWLNDAADPTVRHAHIVRWPANGGAPTVLVTEGEGGLAQPRALAFGPDGNLYVADASAGVLRFDGASGAALGALVPSNHDGLVDASALAFGDDGRLYVASATQGAVLRFDAATGAFVDTFIAPHGGGLDAPRGLAFGPDRNLYVSTRGFNQVLRFDGRTGAPLGAIPGEPGFRAAGALAFTPEARRETRTPLQQL